MDIIGSAVALLIILVLAYALVKQVRYTKMIEHMAMDSSVKKQWQRKHRVMTVALVAVLLCYTLNIVSAYTTVALSNNGTALGTFVSFFVYIYAKFAMAPKQVRLYS